jgi:type I restriction enzyme M protein
MFEGHRKRFEQEPYADPEDRDEHRAENIFWVFLGLTRGTLRVPHGAGPLATIGQIVDDAMAAIERDTPARKGVLPKDYARTASDKRLLGQLIDRISSLSFTFPYPTSRGEGPGEGYRAKEVLGRVYEFLLSQFASAQCKKRGEFYTPRCAVKFQVETLEPYRGRIYDPYCGASGMFVRTGELIEARATGYGNGGRTRSQVGIYGQELNSTTRRLAKIKLATRGIDEGLAHRFPDLKADFILANPPLNISDLGGERLCEDKRWKHGIPALSNANFVWVHHIRHHLAPAGVADYVLAKGSMVSKQSGEGEIRRSINEAVLVNCVVPLPGQLFHSTQISACLWFLVRDRKDGKFRGRRGEVLLIDTRKMGERADRTRRELPDGDIACIAGTRHPWRGETGASGYKVVPGFCKSAMLEEFRKHGDVLTPGR